MMQIPAHIKATLLLNTFGLFKVPVIFFLRPRVLEISHERIVVKIPLRRRSKNHLGSMYFGALAAGADCVVGLLAVHLMRELGHPQMHLSFKDFHADFLKRAMGDVHFVCDSGPAISQQIKEAAATQQRVNLTVPAYAIVPDIDPKDPVATFTLTLSLKAASSAGAKAAHAEKAAHEKA
jgi:acyl-coenzyme A thioesterase PaaI-like protein